MSLRDEILSKMREGYYLDADRVGGSACLSREGSEAIMVDYKNFLEVYSSGAIEFADNVHEFSPLFHFHIGKLCRYKLVDEK